MLAYVILVGVPLLYLCVLQGIRSTYRLDEIPYRGSVLKVFFGIYFLLLALRSSAVGTDAANYISKFAAASNMTWSAWLGRGTSEVGFAFLTKLVSTFTDNEQVYLAVVAAFILFPIAHLYSRESEDPMLTMVLFLSLPMFGMFFSGFRQSIAIAMAVPAYYFTRNRKKLKFVITVFAAMLFHQSAFILFLLYPVYHMKLTRKMLIWIVPVLLAVYLFSDRIFAVLLVVLSQLYEEQIWEIEATGAYSMLLLFVLLLVFCYIFTDEDSAETDVIGLRNILVLSVVLQCFASVNTLAMRMNYYYLLFLPLLIPKVIRRAKGKNALTCKIINAVFCVYFLYYFLNQAYGQKSGFQIYPYVPFWEA